MTKNDEYEFGNVIIRITNLSLWKYCKNDDIPHHKFQLKIVDHENRTLYKKDMVLRGHSMDFEFKKSALVCIKKALKMVDKNLIPQSVGEGCKFVRFLEEFNDKLNKNLDYGQPVCTLFD